MKKSMLFAAVVLLTVSVVNGQVTKEDPCKHGLLFDVEGFKHFGLGDYGCGMGKKFIRGNYAIRPTLSFSTFRSEEDLGVTGWSGETDKTTKIGIDLDFLRHMNTTMKLQPYYGLGLNYESVKGTTESAHSVQVNPLKTDSTQSTFGVRGIVGAEYFLSKHFSLSCEYRIGYFQTTERIKISGADFIPNFASVAAAASPELKRTRSGFRIHTNPRLTLGVYF